MKNLIDRLRRWWLCNVKDQHQYQTTAYSMVRHIVWVECQHCGKRDLKPWINPAAEYAAMVEYGKLDEVNNEKPD